MALFIVALCWIYRSVQFQGHDWGDDFALYINQARGLANGTVAQVVADNRYALENSGSSTFSPYVYPWGFPIMLLPVFVAFGINYAAFKFVAVICLCIFVVAFHLLLRRRMADWAAWSLTLLIALSPSYAFWTDSVTSDFPALAFVFLTLLWIDRCRRLDLFGGPRFRPLIMLGLLAGWSMSIRREPAALLAALAAIQLLYVAGRWRAKRSMETVRALPWKHLAAPWAAAFGLVIGLQVMLPSSIGLSVPGGGWAQLKPNIIWFRDILAEHLGLRQAGVAEFDLYGSRTLGIVVFGTFVALVLIGLIGQLVLHRSRDAHLAAYLLAVVLVIGRLPFHEGRYLFAITPLMAYFAFQAVPSVAAAIAPFTQRRRVPEQSVPATTRLVRAAPFVSLALFAPMIQSNWTVLSHGISYHRDYDYVEEGPEMATSHEMFDAVRRCTRGDDVVMFNRARAMNLYTGRRAIQTGGLEEAVRRSDWMVVDNSDVDYYEPQVGEYNAAEHGLVRVWHNDIWSLYRVHPTAIDGREPCPPEVAP